MIICPMSSHIDALDDAALAAPASADPTSHAPWQRLVGRAPCVRHLENAITRVGGFDCAVLVTGETGCGKEEVVRAIHAAGRRSGGPFVAVNCGGVVATLAESLLFGHVRGAFTGADDEAPGAFRVAHGGTLFLDEIGELPLDIQPKLLRALQQREVVPVGGVRPVTIDVQVIAATNRDLATEVAAGRFREDLLYRLNTAELQVPPLRDRRDDIPRFVERFAAHYADRFHMPRWQPGPALMERLVQHAWPGNVRELAQLVQRVYIFGDRIDEVVDAFFAAAGSRQAPPAATSAPGGGRQSDPVLPMCHLATLRAIAVRQALATTDGKLGRAAEMLGVCRNTMTKLVAEALPERAGRQGRRGVKRA
jgi:DNA-binding NtrC family response regulator